MMKSLSQRNNASALVNKTLKQARVGVMPISSLSSSISSSSSSTTLLTRVQPKHIQHKTIAKRAFATGEQ